MNIPVDSPLADLAKLLTIQGGVAMDARCRACGQKNRVRAKHLSGGRKPRCGKCGLPLAGF